MDDVRYSELHAQVLREPWRRGLGQPNALDPTWRGYDPPECPGEIWWEPGTGWWTCLLCGYIGSATTQIHTPVQRPLPFLVDSVGFYFTKRQQQGASFWASLQQLLFVAGMSVRYAAVMAPEEVGTFSKKLLPM
jgi:hypothetical protein